MAPRAPIDPARASTGVAGLDAVVRGGLPAKRTYIVRGRSGAGKTTLGLQFVLEGVRRGERALYVMLTETHEEILEVARSHGWSLDGVHVHEVVERPEELMREAQSTLFSPSEIELGDTVLEIADLARRVQPSRVVIDPLSELRLMADNPLRFRRQFLALKQVFADIDATSLLVEEWTTGETGDEHLENVAHGVILLDQLTPTYGPDRRRLRVMKVRGVRHLGGYHDLDIVRGGMVVYPRPVDVDGVPASPFETVSTLLSPLDEMLGGGLEQGTSTLLVGETGTGKSSVLAHCVNALVEQGSPCILYLFEERARLFLKRSESLGLPLGRHIESGEVMIVQVEPEDMSPGALLQHICDSVEISARRAVVLDSMSGLARTMYDEPVLPSRLRELFAWLSRRGVLTFASLQNARALPAATDIFYLADTVILLEHIEQKTGLSKAISVLKRRGGEHETVMRELRLSPSGLIIGRPVGEAAGAELFEVRGRLAYRSARTPRAPSSPPAPRRSEKEDGQHPPR